MGEPKKDVIRETDAEAIRLAKTLLRRARFGALAVIEPQPGSPLASRVGVATDIDGAPLILVSMLSAHTGACSPIRAAPCCSANPARAIRWRIRASTLVCRAAQLERGSAVHARAERRYLNRNPRPSSMPASAISRSFASSRNAPASMAASARPICSIAPIWSPRADRRRTGGRRTIRARPHEHRPSRCDRQSMRRHFAKARRRLDHHRLRSPKAWIWRPATSLPGLFPARFDVGAGAAARSGRHGQAGPCAGLSTSDRR